MTEPYSYFGLAGENHNHDARYPAGDPTASTDGYVWTYDAVFGGYLPKAPSGGAGAVDSVDGRIGAVTLGDIYKSAGYVPTYSEVTGKPTAFNPTAHKTSHGTDGADAIAPGDIGAATGDHAHAKLDRLPDAETSQRVVYVSPAGSDSTGDGSSTAPWAAIQYAVDQARTIMQRVNSASAYKIVCATGTYDAPRLTIPANLLSSFNSPGQGGIWIISETQTASDVVITSNDNYASVITFGSCTMEKVTIEGDSIGINAAGSPASSYVYIRDCIFRRRTAANGGSVAIFVDSARCHSFNNSSVAGRLFAYGLRADANSVITKRGAQPLGATANELTEFGAVIR